MFEDRASMPNDKTAHHTEFSAEKHELKHEIEFYSPWSSSVKTPSYPRRTRNSIK